MPVEQIGNALVFQGFLTDGGIGKEGLVDATWDIYKVTTTGSSLIIPDAAAVEIGGGFYRYTLALGSVDVKAQYTGKLKTATTVDQFEVAMSWTVGPTWVERLDVALTALAALIWSYATRVLTQPAASINSAITGDELTLYKYSTFLVPLTGLGSLTGYTAIYFTFKHNTEEQDDSESIIQIVKRETDPGLLFINGEVATAGNGSIEIDDEDDGDITIKLKAVEAAKLDVRGGFYDVKIVRAAAPEEFPLTVGELSVVDIVTQATS